MIFITTVLIYLIPFFLLLQEFKQIKEIKKYLKNGTNTKSHQVKKEYKTDKKNI